jgi:hypothetical protein
MMQASDYERIVIDRFHFTGFHGCRSCCALEIIRVADGRSAVIATELPDNPGTSITNAFELVASAVCLQFAIDPHRLVWIEHYGYASAFAAGNPRPFDLVSFDVWPDRDRRVAHPQWKRMHNADWLALGLTPRPPVEYPPRR